MAISYVKASSYPLKSSCSALVSNLSVLQTSQCQFLACAHRSSVSIVVTAQDGSVMNQRCVQCKQDSFGNSLQSAPVISAMFASAGQRHFLVIITSRSVQVFDADGTALLLHHPIKEAAPRGICPLDERFLCVGTGAGDVLLFSVPKSSGPVCHHSTVHIHSSGITALLSLEDVLVTGHEDGVITLWGLNGEKLNSLSGTKPRYWPVNALTGHVSKFIIAGFGDGKLLGFEGEGLSPLFDVSAHGRSITGLDVCDRTGFLVSCGEDCYARFWQLSEEGNCLDIKHLSNILVTDQLLLGAQLLLGDKAVALTAFESNEIHIYRRK